MIFISFLFAFLVGEGEKRFPTLPSSVKGVYLGNLHQLSPYIYRSAAPEKYIDQLEYLGIKSVVIVKAQSHHEVDQEIALLKAHQISYQWFDLPWKNISNYVKECEKIKEALFSLRQAHLKKQKTLLHCTVGEDRTGLISALYRISEDRWSLAKAYHEEMCAKGYGFGNKNKPDWVSLEVQKNLSPLFQAMASAIQTKGLDQMKCETLSYPSHSIYGCKVN